MDIPLWKMIAFSFTTGVVLFALWKGGPPERAVAVLLFIGTRITPLIPDRRWIDVQTAMLLVDIAAFVLLTGLALWVDRWWLMWTAGLQGLAVVVHLAFWAQQKVISLVYITALNMLGYAVFVTLLIGTVTYMQRRRRLSAGIAAGGP